MTISSEPQNQLTPLKRAFLAIEELQARLAAAERARHAPIAVIGIGCRLPGGVDGPDAYWRLLCDEVDAIGAIPSSRWDVEALYDPDPNVPGKMSQRVGGFLDEIDRFDPQFFGIAPREAAAMDPQQRLLLEVTWEALEHAGQAPAKLAGSATGVYIAVTSSDYLQVHLTNRGLDGLDAYFASGVAHSIASGRLAYILGLQGPSLTIDTACSSSLVAVHLALQSLRAGETRLALAGGVNLILSPENSITLSKHQMLAPDGRCKFGDTRADGFVRGEGCAIVALKRLSDALADGDRVLAVISGSAVNQDGASSGLTAPNGPAQQAVVRAALADAGLTPAMVSYVEAHGTGTALGDPIELQALGAVFDATRLAGSPLVVGSVKTNLGHLEATAGIAGLIKLVLMLQHKQIPASLHFTTPSPQIPWDALSLRVPTTLEPWVSAVPRVAGVSSFGFSGTNAHLVLAEAPPHEAPEVECERPLHLLPLSARSEQALRELAERYARELGTTPQTQLAELAFTAGSGRSHFSHRLAIVAADSSAAAAQLGAFAQGERVPGLSARHSERADPPRIAFLFTGQGAQYAGMGRDLYATQPVFRATLDRCAATLDQHLDRPLLDLLFAEPGSEAAQDLDQTAYTQPALVALEFALAELWRSWGIEPAALLGHSVGEYTAAILAGVCSLEDGLALVATRGRLMQQLPAGGAMATIFAASSTIKAALEAYAGQVSVAAYNGPEHTVVAGPVTAIESLIGQFTAAGVRAQRLHVSHAFHSPLIEPALDTFEQAVATVQLRAPRMRLLSNLTGELAGQEMTTPAYWRRHAREPVRFAQGVERLAKLGCEIFIEIGPHPALLGMAQAMLPPEQGYWLPSLRRNRDGWQQLLESLSHAYTAGVEVDWAGFDRAYGRRKLALPTYPFQRERYWIDPRPGAKLVPRRRNQDEHPLLGRRLRSALRQVQFECELAAGDLTYLDDHRVFGLTILPAAAFTELALAAARAALGTKLPGLDALEIHAPFALAEGETRVLQTVLFPTDDGATVEILSQGEENEAWSLHASAAVIVAPAEQSSAANVTLAELRERCPEPVAPDSHYTRLRTYGLDLGSSLQVLTAIQRGESEALGELTLPAAAVAESDHYMLHPALLDACLQLFAIAAPATKDAFLPIALDSLRLYGALGGRATAHAWIQPSAGHETLVGAVRIFDLAGNLIAALDGVRLKRGDLATLSRISQAVTDDWLYTVAWRPLPTETDITLAAHFLPPPAVMSAAAIERLPSLAGELNLAHYRQLLPLLDELATTYIGLALHHLGWEPRPGEAITGAQLAEQLGVIPAQRALFNRLLALLAEDGVLRSLTNGWEVVRPPVADKLIGHVNELATRYPFARGDIELTRRCGEGLAEVLRGHVDPLQLLFPGGSLGAAEQLYRESPLARAYTTLLAEAVAATLEQLPAERILRVLEVGAGTGGATSAVLPRLPAARTSYTFTDISPLFLARARESFAAYSFVEYRTLDIEADPASHGFTLQNYDLIIAANVIHATTDLRRSFANLQRLLAPGGILVLLEMTTPMRWIDLTFGMTEGWWKFSDRDLRPNYVLLNREGWLNLLHTVGLEQPVALPNPGDHGLNHQQIVLARAPYQSVGALPATMRKLLIFADATGVGERLAAQIVAQGGQATLVTPGDAFEQPAPDRYQLPPNNGEAFAQLLHTDHGTATGSWDGVVYLWSLDAQTLFGSDPAPGQQTLLGGALQLAQTLVREGAGTRLWLVTRGAQATGGTAGEPSQATLWGLGKTIALEHPELQVTCVDLDPAPEVDAAAQLLAELLRGDEPQVALRSDKRLAARLVRTKLGVPAQTEEAPPVELHITSRGSLDNLELRPLTRRTPGPGEVEIRVAATALNFKDVLNLLDLYPGTLGPPGSECAGTVVAVGPDIMGLQPGDEVVALASGSFRSYTTVAAEFVALRPPGLSAEEAITIPIAYVTAAFALQHLGQLRAGERVLIHAAAGGVGLAAVHLALRAGAEVFATAGSPAKRAYLRSLGVQHIFDSRSLAFADAVRAATDGQGVDLVLNSLAGAFVARSLELLRAGGRFLELGKRDHLTATQAAELGQGLSYHVIDWGDNAREEPELIRGILSDVLAGVACGAIPPLPYKAFPLSAASAAFRYMAQARHIGKVVVTLAGAQSQNQLIHPNATYLITGGLSGLGLLTASWLVEQGARYLALMGRRGATAESTPVITELERSGARVMIISGDVARAEDVAAALEQIATALPPLRGVIHAAGVLDDASLTQQNWQRFANVLDPKLAGAWQLHTQTAGLPLDFFVLYSSAASLLGSAGQTNHAAANSFLDALAHWRHAEGLPAVSINWGAWGEVGAAVTTGAVTRIEAKGINVITPAQGLALLGRLLTAPLPQVGVVPINWPTFLDHFNARVPTFFAELAQAQPAPVLRHAESATHDSAIMQQLAAAPPQRRPGLLRDFTRATVGHVLGLATARIDDELPLSTMGLDSLMAVELRNLLGVGLGLQRRLPATLAFDYPTVMAITGYLAADVLSLSEPAVETPSPSVPADSTTMTTMIDELEELSDAEIDRLLAEKLRG